MKIIYVTVFLFITCITSQISCIKSKKKALKAAVTESPESTSHPAIIAIEIVDPNENATKSKNSKRTIETALGYGYNTYDTSKPRYEIYKYSQHDIPPYKGDSSHLYKSSTNAQSHVQKSVQYTLPTVTEQVPSTNNLLKPGMTLYSSLSAKGQIGGLTSSLSQISGLEHNQAPVPVIVLRIYPDQLKDSTIQANLPQSHPFAKSINSINIQSLLDHYIKALQNQNSYTYTAPTQVQSTNYYYNQDSYQKPAGYQPSKAQVQQYQYYQQGYPEDSRNQHHQQQQYSNYDSGVQIQQSPAKYEFSYQVPTLTKQLQKATSTVAPQYYYVQPNVQHGYSTESSQYYQPTQQVDYSTHQRAPQVQQYYNSGDQQQYQQYYQGAEESQYVPKSQKLLTAENYPTDKHTKVVFRTNTGNVRTPEQEETPTKEIKTIKIQVPDNIAKVEVQETERPYYDYQQSYTDDQQNVDQSADIYDQEQGGYSNPSPVQHDYYKNEDNPADVNYNYQNIDYEQMIKYFAKRGAMPSYFYQEAGDEEGDDQQMSNDDMVAAYEDAAFPSTTAAPQKKKAKSKKRT